MLVQINGKRFNRSALVQVYIGGDTGLSFGSQGADISAIPSIAIKNLQVLRDGATAQYGSDAIAGVMNFGMRNDRNNLELQARYGQFYDHGHTKLDSGKSRQIAGTAGIGIGATGFIDVAGEWFKDDGTSTGETRPVAVDLRAGIPGPRQPTAQLSAAGADLGLVAAAWLEGHGQRRHRRHRATANSISPASAPTTTANESFNYRSPITRPATATVDVAGNTHTSRRERRVLRALLPDALPGRERDLPRRRLSSTTTTPSCSPTSIRPGFTPRFVGITKERWGTAAGRASSAAD